MKEDLVVVIYFWKGIKSYCVYFLPLFITEKLLYCNLLLTLSSTKSYCTSFDLFLIQKAVVIYRWLFLLQKIIVIYFWLFFLQKSYYNLFLTFSITESYCNLPLIFFIAKNYCNLLLTFLLHKTTVVYFYYGTRFITENYFNSLLTFFICYFSWKIRWKKVCTFFW